jgi:hypothetical protein
MTLETLISLSFLFILMLDRELSDLLKLLLSSDCPALPAFWSSTDPEVENP